MPVIFATAPGKAILFGEHAVVYHRPAIAVPVMQVRAKAAVSPLPQSAYSQIQIQAPEISLEANLSDLPLDDPLAMAVRGTLDALKISIPPAFSLRITSTIPIAAGLGSGAAVSVAIIRAVSAFFGTPLENTRVNELAYRVECRHHGTPSGIDNTVITYAQPLYFVRGQPMEMLPVGSPFTLVIGDTGVSSLTASVVNAVHERRDREPEIVDAYFDRIADITDRARSIITSGEPQEMGPLMTENHHLLRELGVSSPELDRLVDAALSAGAWGAKLSGAGRGGNMIALTPPENAPAVVRALGQAGATRAIVTHIEAAP